MRRKRPSYLHHKQRNLAYTRIYDADGKRQTIYLGEHLSPESHEAFHRALEGWLQSHARESTEQLTVSDVGRLFLEHAKQYYRKPDGRQTSEVGCLRSVLNLLVEHIDDCPASQFDSPRLDDWLQNVAAAGYARKTINSHLGRIKRMFKWAARQKLIRPGIYQELCLVDGLRAGRSPAKDTPPVSAVPIEQVNALQAHLPPAVWAMVKLQLFTGMRPGEVVRMRSCDLDRSGEIWMYQPAEHKTQHHGRDRVITLGERAKEVLTPFIDRKKSDQYLFSPREAPHVPTKRKVGEKYSVDSYRQCVQRACEYADISSWSPNQLRHTAATEIRKQFGLEAAQVTLGHSSANITQVYAERDMELAKKVAESLG
ncbi:tyrosine-type recombinase/integrase [Planctomycetaceae bacterium]|nr:tyrosine-type recombinase/integrase [Planctomycetaceae bacterium]